MLLDEDQCRVELLSDDDFPRVVEVIEPGERYLVRGCPLCRSTTSKLVISHAYHPFLSSRDWSCSAGGCEHFPQNAVRLALMIARLCTGRNAWRESAQTPRA